jgi:hypothetical protein
MPFVYEPVPEADKQRIDFSKIKVHLKKVNTYRWTVDRELDAFLIWGHPEREPPYARWYAFWWQGRIFDVARVEHPHLIAPDGRWIGKLEIVNIVPPVQMRHPGAELNAAVRAIRDAVRVDYLGMKSETKWKSLFADVQIQMPTRIPTPFGLWPPIPAPVEVTIDH